MNSYMVKYKDGKVYFNNKCYSVFDNILNKAKNFAKKVNGKVYYENKNIGKRWLPL